MVRKYEESEDIAGLRNNSLTECRCSMKATGIKLEMGRNYTSLDASPVTWKGYNNKHLNVVIHQRQRVMYRIV